MVRVLDTIEMDWSNESYVRLYVRDTLTWKLLKFEGQAVLALLMRKLDRAGVLEIGEHDPIESVAIMIDAPIDFVRTGFSRCLERGVFVIDDTKTKILMPNYLPAQEASKSDKLRSKESRDKRRALSGLSQIVTVPSRTDVTTCDKTVTAGHNRSQRDPLNLNQCSTSAMLNLNARARDSIITENPKSEALDTPPEAIEYEHSQYVWQGVIRDWNEITGQPHDALSNQREAEALLRLATTMDGKDPQSVIRKAFSRWLADDWVKSNHPPLSNLVKFFDRHISDAPPEEDEPIELGRAACYERDTKIQREKEQRDLERWKREQSEMTEEDREAMNAAKETIAKLTGAMTDNTENKSEKVKSFQEQREKLRLLAKGDKKDGG